MSSAAADDVKVGDVPPAAAVAVDDVTITHGNSEVDVTDADMALYRAHKDELGVTLKKEGNVYFMDRGDYAGILNQGATCYMNSLLQALFHTPRFRRRLYNWTYKPERDGESEYCIPLALQKLFARLQAGHKAACTTKELTHSFRWTNARAFQQHDVQEFFSKLFSAVEDATEGYSMVTDLYEGKMVDYLSCQSCTFERRRTEAFRELELEIGIPTVLQSLNAYQGQELLSGDNKWFCSRCDAKVDAAKGVQLQDVPPIFTLHLKRFSFDFNLMRRVKLNNRFFLQPYLRTRDFLRPIAGASEGKGDEGEAGEVADRTYELFAVMIHQGTARGGHYFAYIKPTGGDDWYEFNDVNVKKLDPADVQQAFDLAKAAEEGKVQAPGTSSPAGNGDEKPGTAKPDVSAPADASAGAGAASGAEKGKDAKDTEAAAEDEVAPMSNVALNMCTNAYLIMYRVVGEGDADVELPSFLKAMTNGENTQFEKMHRVFKIRQAIAALDVYDANNNKVSIDVPTARTLTEATAIAYDALYSGDGANEDGSGTNEPAAPLERCRLRRFVPQSSRPTETFEGRTDLPLRDIGIVNAAAMYLESRGEGEEFECFNPNEMVAHLMRWDADTGSIQREGALSVKVAGDQAATVGQLRDAVSAATGVPRDQARLVAIDEQRAVVVTLEDDATELRSKFGFRSGEDVVLEVLGEGETMDGESPSVRQFDLTRNVITICYNHPDKPDDIDRETPSNRNYPLRVLKANIAEELGLDEGDFHLRRSRTAPQFKDETATLKELGLVDQSMVFVAMGAPMSPDQYGLEVYIYRPEEIKSPFKHIISNFPASETQSIGSLKRQIAAHAEVNHPANKLRLRERSRRDAGAIFRDTQSVRSAIRNLADGHMICVQLLNFVERTTRQDMVISLRIWRPLKRKIQRSDVVVKRKSTVGELWELLHNRFDVGVDSPCAGYPEPDPEAAADDDESKVGGVRARLAAASRNTRAEAANASDATPTPPAGEDGPDAVASPEPLTQEQKEAAAVAAALKATPSGIGLVKMPTYPALTLSAVWKYAWNKPRLLPHMGLTTCGFRDATTFVVRDETEFAIAKARRKKKPSSGPAKGGRSRLASRRPKKWAPPSGRSSFGGHENVLTIGGDGGAAAAAESGPSLPDWACPACTFNNPGRRTTCEICGAARPPVAPNTPAAAATEPSSGDNPK